MSLGHAQKVYQQNECSVFNTGTCRFRANRCMVIGWGTCEKAAVCQLSCNMSAELNCTLPSQLSCSGKLSCQLRCNWSAQLPSVSFLEPLPSFLGTAGRFGGRGGIVHCTNLAMLKHYSAVCCIIVIVKYRETGDCTKPRTLEIPEYRQSRDHSRYYRESGDPTRYYRVFRDSTSCAPGSVLQYIESPLSTSCKPGFVLTIRINPEYTVKKANQGLFHDYRAERNSPEVTKLA